MKRLIYLLIVLLFSMLGCKKGGEVKPQSYTIKIETALSNYYSVKVETTDGVGTVYLNQKELKGIKTFTVIPNNREAVSLYYSTVGSLWIKIYINDKLIINQTQPDGQSLFYLKHNM